MLICQCVGGSRCPRCGGRRNSLCGGEIPKCYDGIVAVFLPWWSCRQVDVDSVGSVRGMIPTSKQRRSDLYSVLDRFSVANTFEQFDFISKGLKGREELTVTTEWKTRRSQTQWKWKTWVRKLFFVGAGSPKSSPSVMVRPLLWWHCNQKLILRCPWTSQSKVWGQSWPCNID